MPDLFNTGFSNNAPPPVPGGYGNPTGIFSTGGLKGNSQQQNPNLYPFPVIGSPSLPGGISPSSGGANGGGLFSATNIQGLSTGFAGTLGGLQGPGGNLLRELQDAYGKGTGTYLDQLLGNGLFNPQVAAAFLNALQPGINRGESDILQAFGAEGSRFGSAASLGLGDYLSQANLNEQQTLASLYEQAQQEQLSLLGGLLPTLHTEQANRSQGWFSSLLNSIGGLFGGGGGAVGGLLGGLGSLFGLGSNSSDSGSSLAGTASSGIGNLGDLSGLSSLDTLLSSSAGSNLGGSDPFQNNPGIGLLGGY